MNLHLILREDIITALDLLVLLNDFLEDYRTNKPGLTLEDSRRIRLIQSDLIQKAAEINAKTIRDLLSDLDQPKQRLLQAIDQASSVIKNLKEINRVLGIVATLIEVFNKISLGLASGGIVLIESLVNSIDQISRA
jgi:hypothetical protein